MLATTGKTKLVKHPLTNQEHILHEVMCVSSGLGITGGTVGGYVENFGNVSTSWIDKDSVVFDNAVISNSVVINGVICGLTHLTDSEINNAKIGGNANIVKSTINDSELLGNGILLHSKVENLSALSNNFHLEYCKVKKTSVQGGHITRTTMNECTITGTPHIEYSDIDGGSVTGGSIKNALLTHCEIGDKAIIKDSQLEGTRVVGGYMMDCILKNCSITGHPYLNVAVMTNCKIPGTARILDSSAIDSHIGGSIFIVNSNIKNCDLISISVSIKHRTVKDFYLFGDTWDTK